MIATQVITTLLFALVTGPFLFAPLVQGHSWIEEVRVISSDGSFSDVSIGYPRGNILRGTPGFSDENLIHRLPIGFNPGYKSVADIQLIDSGTPMCRASQTKGNQTPGSPSLKASPGDMIALRYQENGHVTLPEPGKAENRGTVYIYGTTAPKDDEKLLDIFGKWNAAGTGGDGRGFLLATRNYDDGRCHQVNGREISTARQAQFPHPNVLPQGGDIWCQTDFVIPSSIEAAGQLTVYWVWDWSTTPTDAVGNGKVEMYTSCLDIDLVDGPGTSASLNYDRNQDIMNAAIEEQLTEPFLVKVPEAEGRLENVPKPNNGNPSPVSSATPEASPSIPVVDTPAEDAPVEPTPVQDGPVIETVFVTMHNTVTRVQPAPTVTIFMTPPFAGPPAISTPTAASTGPVEQPQRVGRPNVQPFFTGSTTLAILPSPSPIPTAGSPAVDVNAPATTAGPQVGRIERIGIDENGNEVIYVIEEITATTTVSSDHGAYTARPKARRSHIRMHARAFKSEGFGGGVGVKHRH